MPATPEAKRRLQAAALAYTERPSVQRIEAVLKMMQGFIHQLAGYFYEKYKASGLTHDDFEAEIKLSIWEALQRYKPCKSEFRTWVYRVVGTRVRDYAETLGTPKKQEEEFDEALEAKYIALFPRDDFRAFEMRWLIEHLAYQIGGKNKGSKDTNRSIFLLYMQGYNVEEIGAKIGMKPDTVGDRWGRIRANLLTYADSDGLDRAAILC